MRVYTDQEKLRILTLHEESNSLDISLNGYNKAVYFRLRNYMFF